MCKFSGVKPASAMKVKAWICAPATDRDLESGSSKSIKCWDPKDGELCLRRAKSGGTLVEARSGTDVHIVRKTWVLGERLI